VPLHKSSNIKFWLLEDLYLTDVTLLDGEDGSSILLNILSAVSSDEGVDKGLEVTLVSKLCHVTNHLFSDSTNLSRLGVTSLLDLVLVLLGESNAKHSYNVSIGSLYINISLDNGLTLLDKTADLITGHIHTVEVGETVEPLDILDTELDLAVSKVFVLLKVSKGDFYDASLESIGGNLLSGRLGDDGLSEVLIGEHGRSLKLVPFLL